MPAFEWVHVQLHQQKGMISLSPPTICNSAHIRYTALSFCYQVAPIMAGSLAPLIALTLLKEFNSSIPISLYLVAASLISIVSILLVKETKGRSLAFKD
ncbi:Inner membrane metabolite transport protein YhjE [Acinetobacter baumannii]|nr:Inner membrane metabolite transport protein YhjE [Acinetobacter baumannii]